MLYSEYLKTLSDEKLLNLWNAFSDVSKVLNKEKNFYKIYSFNNKTLFAHFPLNEIASFIINGKVNLQDKYFFFNNKTINTLSDLTSNDSPIDFFELSLWIKKDAELNQDSIFNSFDLKNPINFK